MAAVPRGVEIHIYAAVLQFQCQNGWNRKCCVADSDDHACAREGFSPHIRQRFIRMETILGYVAAGAGVSLLLEKELTAFNLQKVAVKKISPVISSSIALVFPHGRHLSPAAAALWSFLENFTGKNR